MRHDPQSVCSSIGEFLGLSDYDYTKAGPITANEGGGKYYASSALTRTINTLKRTPIVKPLLKQVPAKVRKSGYDWLANGPVGRRLRRRHQNTLSKLTPEVRKQLCELFRSDVEELEAFTGRDLTAWKSDSC